MGQAPQVERLKNGVDILVATPGRLGDLYGQKLIDLSRLEIFVLDEADRMLDMGFIHDVRRILGWLPAQKQTLFFSATMPPEVQGLVDSLLHNPAKVAVNPISSPVEVIDQKLYYVDRGNKTRLLAALIRELSVKNALVFTRTKHGANKGRGSGQGGYLRRRHPRQQEPDRPTAGPGRLQRRRGAGPGGYRHRRPGPGH